MRGLTPAEIALLQEAFGERVDYEKVRLSSGAGRNAAAIAAFRKGNIAITLGRSVYFRKHYSDDFAEADVFAQSLFHHEIAHVWQYAALGRTRFLARYARELAACRFNALAMYRYEEGSTRFGGARLEAQAQMIGDYCLARLIGDEGRQARIARNLEGSGFYGF